MILLDTDVLSALMRDGPDPAVVAWLDGEDAGQVWTTTVTVFEIRHGLARLAARREAAGRHVDFRDTLIAGVALSRRAVVATRNIRHFDDLSPAPIDPWQGVGQASCMP